MTDTVPWTTATEHADVILQHLDLSADAEAYARELAARYDGTLGNKPLTVAASAVYLAALMRNEKVTQARVAEASGRSSVSIRRCYREMASEEGIPIGGRRSPAPESDDPPRWSVTLPSWPVQLVRLFAFPVALVVVVGLGMAAFYPPGSVDAEAYARAAERIAEPAFIGVMPYLVLATVALGLVLSVGMRWFGLTETRHDRGQVSNPTVLIYGFVVLVVTSIVLLLGVDLFNAISAQPVPAEDIKPGAPVFTPSMLEVMAVTGLFVLLTGAAMGALTSTSTSEPAEPDGVTVLQDRYVEGELDLDEFEDQVYDEVEVTIE